MIVYICSKLTNVEFSSFEKYGKNRFFLNVSRYSIASLYIAISIYIVSPIRHTLNVGYFVFYFIFLTPHYRCWLVHCLNMVIINRCKNYILDQKRTRFDVARHKYHSSNFPYMATGLHLGSDFKSGILITRWLYLYCICNYLYSFYK